MSTQLTSNTKIHMSETTKDLHMDPHGDFKPEAVQLEYGQTDPAHKVEFIGRQLGTLRAYDDDGRVYLNPQPSDSGDDPLNWSAAYKRYVVILSCVGVLCCNMTGAGPTIAIVQQCLEFVGPVTSSNITKTAYLFNSTALLQGVGLLLWVPAISTWGRRPAYVFCLALYLVSLVWVAVAKTYAVELVGRIVLGFATGAGECLGALIVTDVFFAHQRGLYMAIYNVLLSCGAAVGMIIAGPLTQHAPSWRYIYYVNIAIIGALLIIVVFTFPETMFERNALILNGHAGAQFVDEIGNKPVTPATLTYASKMRLFRGKFTQESYWRMASRPFGLVFLPAVLFSVLAFSATIGFLVAVVSNVSPAFQEYLGFTPQSVGLLFFGAIIGSLMGIPAGGWMGDWCVNYGARKNNGVREPEHRLPAMVVPVIMGPLSLILYGLCIDKQTHWMVGCIGISLVNFNVCAATNIAMVYTIDCYKPIADEVITTTLAFKAIIGFVLGFYTNNWVAAQGYLAGYGQMAAIEGGMLLLTLPMYIYGKRLRNWSANWQWVQWAVQWRDDRDDLKTD